MESNLAAPSDPVFWYALLVKSRHEFVVAYRLESAGVDHFLPVVERLRRWKDRKKLVTFPLFAGYLFVRLPQDNCAFLQVLKTPGVARILGTKAGRFDPVPESQIASLQRIVAQKGSFDPYPYLKEGQGVLIKRGLLAGVEGILVRKAGQHLVVVSIDLIRQGVSVKIEVSDLEPL